VVARDAQVATRVVLMEPYWNSAIEDQAIDRCHRIGQVAGLLAPCESIS
jgi:SNF2 family DNA or RNA helicase